MSNFHHLLLLLISSNRNNVVGPFQGHLHLIPLELAEDFEGLVSELLGVDQLVVPFKSDDGL